MQLKKRLQNVLNAGHRTSDIAVDKSKAISTTEMGDLIVAAIQKKA